MAEKTSEKKIRRIKRLAGKGLSNKEIGTRVGVDPQLCAVYAGRLINGLFFTSFSEYLEYLAEKRGDDSYVTERELFNRNMEKEDTTYDFFAFCDKQPQWNPPESRIERAELREMIHQALDQLSRRTYGVRIIGQREAEVIRRRFFEGETYTAIGKSLGIGVERVRQIKARALEELYPIVRQLGLDDCCFDNMGIV